MPRGSRGLPAQGSILAGGKLDGGGRCGAGVEPRIAEAGEGVPKSKNRGEYRVKQVCEQLGNNDEYVSLVRLVRVAYKPRPPPEWIFSGRERPEGASGW